VQIYASTQVWAGLFQLILPALLLALVMPSVGTGTSVSDTGLSPSTTYYYRAWSEVTVTGSQQWSDGYAQASAVTNSAGTLYVDDDYNNSTSGWGVDHFAAIEAAVDAASPGDTILVAAGIYTENVEVDKSVTIQSQDGASETTVDGSTTEGHTFNVTADNVNISGFTVTGATARNKAGIYLDQVESCNISANICTNNYYGIYADKASNNTLTNNSVNSNSRYGVYLDNSSNNMLTNNTVSGNSKCGVDLDGSNSNTLTGNSITDNNIGVKIQGPVNASTISINFNNISGNTEYGVDNSSSGIVDATHNWWGSASGPGGVGPGTGDMLGNNVNYDPWLRAQIGAVKAKVTETGNDTVDARSEADSVVEKWGAGTARVTVAKYSSNPGTAFSGNIGKYVDVHIGNTTDITQIEIKLYYTEAEVAGLVESSLRMRWWDGSTSVWTPCSDSGVNIANNYIWAKVRSDTVPSLTQLTDTPFGGNGSPPPVGGTIYPVNKLVILTPWITLGLAIIAGAIILLRRRIWSKYWLR